MCKELCGYDREPANSRESRIWRKMHYNNHGVWPKNLNVSSKQLPTSKPDPVAVKSSPAEEWHQASLFDVPGPNYIVNH